MSRSARAEPLTALELSWQRLAAAACVGGVFGAMTVALDVLVRVMWP